MSEGGNYFSSPKEELELVSSGSTLLDCVLGGGYPIGRIVNIVGDKSTGKTLLAIEAAANFRRQYPDGMIWYREVEAAFDMGYAKALGMPVNSIDFGDTQDFFTVEDIFEDLTKQIKDLEDDQRGLYIIDSLDALSDRDELDRDISKGTFGATKAKKMSELFRRLVQKISNKNIIIMIISQVRDKIGVMFGEKHTRSGGRALDFYASQVLWLSNMGKIKEVSETAKGIERVTGIRIKATAKKNKISLPFRECELDIVFGFGVDDLAYSIDFLNKCGKLEDIGFDSKNKATRYINKMDELDDKEYFAKRADISAVVKKAWYEIEDGFISKRRKY